MKQLLATGLIWKLLVAIFRYGNQPVYYHCPPPCAKDAPLEVERVVLRTTVWGTKKLTIV